MGRLEGLLRVGVPTRSVGRRQTKRGGYSTSMYAMSGLGVRHVHEFVQLRSATNSIRVALGALLYFLCTQMTGRLGHVNEHRGNKKAVLHLAGRWKRGGAGGGGTVKRPTFACHNPVKALTSESGTGSWWTVSGGVGTCGNLHRVSSLLGNGSHMSTQFTGIFGWMVNSPFSLGPSPS